MSSPDASAVTYRLKGPDIEITYDQGTSKLNVTRGGGGGGDFDVAAAAEPGFGLRITTPLLLSSRNGTEIMLALLLPAVTRHQDSAPETVTGVAIITSSFEQLLFELPAVLHRYDEVMLLEGTATPTA